MRALAAWIVATLVLAAGIHIAAVWATPLLVNRAWFARLENEGPRLNVLGNARRAKPAGADIVGYDNPDNVSSFMMYDVSDTPVRLHLRVVREAVYWSVSFVADDTDVFGLIRDSDTDLETLHLVLVGPQSSYSAQAGEQVIRSPTQRGLVLVRMIVPDRSDADSVSELVAIRNESYSEPVQAE